jgi:hypothetical protein
VTSGIYGSTKDIDQGPKVAARKKSRRGGGSEGILGWAVRLADGHRVATASPQNDARSNQHLRGMFQSDFGCASSRFRERCRGI